MIEFECLHCGHRLSVSNKHAGKKRPCKACKHTVTVPKRRKSEAAGSKAGAEQSSVSVAEEIGAIPEPESNRGGDAAGEIERLRAELECEREARTALERRLEETELRLRIVETSKPEAAAAKAQPVDKGQAVAAPRAPAREETPLERLQYEAARLKAAGEEKTAFSGLEADKHVERLRNEVRDSLETWLLEARLRADDAAGMPTRVLAGGSAPDAAQADKEELARRLAAARLGAENAEIRAEQSVDRVRRLTLELKAARGERLRAEERLRELEARPPESMPCAQMPPDHVLEAPVEETTAPQTHAAFEETSLGLPSSHDAEAPAEEVAEEAAAPLAVTAAISEEPAGEAEGDVSEAGGKEAQDDLAAALEAWGAARLQPAEEEKEGAAEASIGESAATGEADTVELDADLAAALYDWGRVGDQKHPAPAQQGPAAEEQQPVPSADETETPLDRQPPEVPERGKRSISEALEALGGAESRRARAGDHGEGGEAQVQPDESEKKRRTKTGKAAMVNALQRFMRHE